MTQTTISAEGPIVLVGAQNGVALIPSPTPLTRLNYFDGKFLRAEDLNREQVYLRSLVQLSNQAGGAGVVHGFTTELGANGALQLSPGLAIDPAGRVLYLPHAASVDLLELIRKSAATTGTASGSSANGNGGGSTSTSGTTGAMGESAFAPCETAATPPPGVTTTFPTDLYLIALAHAEALCGEEDVYGRLCEAACVTSTDRPFRLEGVVVRALPLSLCPPTCDAPWLSAVHRRSRIASAYYATERMLYGKDMSGARLGLDLWCRGAEAQPGSVVPLAVVSINGDTVEFLDAWTARRERIEAPPRRYWAWQTMMRPWNVFLAQVLQFQCHLHQVLGEPGTPGGTPDPCDDTQAALRQAVALLDEVEQSYAEPAADGNDVFRPAFLTRIGDLKARWSSALEATDVPSGTRILINGGIIELPPAGYLPIVPGNVDVNTQVRRLLGEGVDLRFCSVRPDYVAHALEEAQHLERICLLAGLENPAQVQEIDILVPDGAITRERASRGTYFETSFAVQVPQLSLATPGLNTTAGPAASETVGGAASASGAGSAAEANAASFSHRPGLFATAQPGIDRPEAAASAAVRVAPQFRGAGRGEQLASGGGAFHFAGLLLQSLEQLASAFERDVASVRRSADDQAAASLFGDLDLGAILARFAGGSHSKKADFSRMNRLETTEFTTGFTTRRVTAAASPPAVWTTFRCEKNPFALNVGESTPIKLEAAGGLMYGSLVAGGQLFLNGDLFCDQKTPSATTRRVAGRARGWVSVSARAEMNGEVNSVQPDPVFIPVTAELELIPRAAGGGEVRITVRTQQGHEFSITTEWDQTPVLAGVSLTIDVIDTMRAVYAGHFANQPEKQKQIEDFIARLEQTHPEYHAVEIARARLRENAEVEREDNSHHAASIKALRTIERALDQEGFFESARSVLFPPAAEVEGTRILPTRDWVLFHRRRVSSCDCCPPERRVIAPPRRYQVYEVTAPEGDVSVEDIREALARGESLEQLAEVVGVVEFDGGSAQLSANNDIQAVLRSWRLANPAERILYGGIASEGAAMNDGAALSEERVARVADLVKSITPLDSGAVFDELALVPNGLSAAGVDGVILLITVPQAIATQRHRVLMLSDGGMMDFVLDEIARNRLGQIIEDNTVLGAVEFQANTETILNDTLEPIMDGWRARWKDMPVGQWVVVQPATDPIPQATAAAQGKAIAAALHGQKEVPPVRSAEDVFQGSVAITILEPGEHIVE